MIKNYQIRFALANDKQEIANLMFFEKHVHRHLDWRNPTDWLDSPFYWVLERNSHIMAALACPKEKNEEAWLRFFTHKENLTTQEAWDALWGKAKEDLEKKGKIKISAITVKGWMESLLRQSGFQNEEQILIMSWEGEKPPSWSQPKGIRFRKMTEVDLPWVVDVDADAFMPLWHNPLSVLQQAYSEAVSATVAESEEGIVGYQISTYSPFGAHLARLAVRAKMQRQGIASALIGDLIEKVLAKEITQISVNTQSKNEHSIALYEKSGFKRTEEEYPIYSFQIAGRDQEKDI